MPSESLLTQKGVSRRSQGFLSHSVPLSLCVSPSLSFPLFFILPLPFSLSLSAILFLRHFFHPPSPSLSSLPPLCLHLSSLEITTAVGSQQGAVGRGSQLTDRIWSFAFDTIDTRATPFCPWIAPCCGSASGSAANPSAKRRYLGLGADRVFKFVKCRDMRVLWDRLLQACGELSAAGTTSIAAIRVKRRERVRRGALIGQCKHGEAPAAFTHHRHLNI